MDQQASNAKSVKSLMLKAGKRTYFFDIKLASNNKKYLKITESLLEEEGKERKYNSFLLFPEQIADFQQTLTESLGYLA